MVYHLQIDWAKSTSTCDHLAGLISMCETVKRNKIGLGPASVSFHMLLSQSLQAMEWPNPALQKMMSGVEQARRNPSDTVFVIIFHNVSCCFSVYCLGNGNQVELKYLL